MTLAEILKAKGYSVTQPRRAVFDTLDRFGALSCSELANKNSGIDRATVYRTVELFEELGVIHRIWLGFKSKVELSEMFNPHHHHFFCVECGQAYEIEDSDLENVLRQIATSSGHDLKEHSVELKGVCSKCH